MEALCLLPERAARKLRAGEVADCLVIRVSDEITVDLMARACGNDYASVETMINPVVVDGITPFASVALENQANPPGKS